MESPSNVSTANLHYLLRSLASLRFTGPSARPAAAPALQTKAVVTAAALLAVVFFFAPRHIAAQQPYPSSPGGYANPYPAQAPNGYAQPQYGDPQYQQEAPQYQSQYAAPQNYPDQQQYANQQQYAAPGYPSEQALAPPQQAPAQALSAGDLEQLIAPIALYPDALLAQILAASTYPAQVAAADQWLQQMRGQGYGDPNQVAAGAMTQTSWDPSIKALTAFPDVLAMLDHNLRWTTNLGNAYYNQPQDVMQTVQVLRQRAQQAGNLQSTPQEDISNSQGYIDIAPPNPEVVYVPTYNPWAVYGQPISPYPGFSLFGALGSFLSGLPVQYGLGFAMTAFEHTPFGLLAWGLDWLAQSVLFNHGSYYSHSNSVADWGLPHGGARAYPGGWRDPARYGYAARYRSTGGTQAWNQHGSFGAGSSRPGNYVRPVIGTPYRPQQSAGNTYNRGEQNFNRGTQPYANNYAHAENPAYTHQYTQQTSPAQQAYNHASPQSAYAFRPQTYPNRTQSYAARPSTQAFSSPAYNYNSSTRGGEAYGARPSSSYANPYSSYRTPQYDNRAYSSHSNPAYGNVARNDSGGYRGFSEKEPKYSAPKYSYKAPKSFGHEKAPKAPKMSHSGGGGSHHHFL